MSKCRSVLVVLVAALIAGCLSVAGQAAPSASGPEGLIVLLLRAGRERGDLRDEP